MTDTNAMRYKISDVVFKSAAHRFMRPSECLPTADAILALLATDRAAGVGEEALVCANCKGMIGDLPDGRDPEEFCDTCYRDALAASSPAPADASGEEARITSGAVWKIARFMGEQEEREAVVNWLRKTGDSKPHGTDWRTYYAAADAIEVEAHRRAALNHIAGAK